ncbi:hypothetical protein AAFF_G00019500 [Aldrovandia affinis]|uniref:Uncharacterized protein n=1 Tax=Aldrovandia affinis TaxID=143900 RepID=A0AAD7WGX3_9TELE|nr:hypothetical protein AAFF_G00019500 [Aldrovandia affinis]
MALQLFGVGPMPPSPAERRECAAGEFSSTCLPHRHAPLLLTRATVPKQGRDKYSGPDDWRNAGGNVPSSRHPDCSQSPLPPPLLFAGGRCACPPGTLSYSRRRTVPPVEGTPPAASSIISWLDAWSTTNGGHIEPAPSSARPPCRIIPAPSVSTRPAPVSVPFLGELKLKEFILTSGPLSRPDLNRSRPDSARHFRPIVRLHERRSTVGVPRPATPPYPEMKRDETASGGRRRGYGGQKRMRPDFLTWPCTHGQAQRGQAGLRSPILSRLCRRAQPH